MPAIKKNVSHYLQQCREVFSEKDLIPLLEQGIRLSHFQLFSFTPTLVEVMLNTEVIKDLADGLMDDVLNTLGVVIKGWYWWQYMCSHIGSRNQEVKVSFVQRGLPDHQDQFSLFL